MTNAVKLTVLLVCFLVVTVGCSRKENHGVQVSGEELTKIENILANPDEYAGKTVKVEGKIVSECPTGCWFNLASEKGVVYVTLPEFTIPQKVGHTAVVEGLVMNQPGRLTIVGKGVEIK
jgi:hypothetical protein